MWDDGLKPNSKGVAMFLLPSLMLRPSNFYDENLVKVQFTVPKLLRKRGHYFKKNFTCLISLDLQKQIGDTIFNGWSCFVSIFQSFCQRNSQQDLDCLSLPTSMTDGREPINHIFVIASCHAFGLTMHLLSIKYPDRELLCTCIVTSGSEHQQSKCGDAANF